MADPHDFEGSTHHFSPPKGFDEMIGWLHVFSNGRTVVSAWKPTPEELRRLNAGESIFVSVMSGSRDGIPVVYPMFVGLEDEVKAIAGDTGRVW